ncbi:MAG TPA: endonuclease/exonuclease/phosphatase family protein [Phycisphaerales bacterium]|nr:endonuclease/exonuclease/phosphatase family protein [Phycisphaerales bacterium]
MKRIEVMVGACGVLAFGLVAGCSSTSDHSNWTQMPPTGYHDAPALHSDPVIMLGAKASRTSFGPAADAEIDFDATGPVKLRVVTFNMEHRDRSKELDGVAAELPEETGGRPEFLLLQEVKFRSGKSNLNDNTAESLGEKLGYNVRATKRESDGEGIAILSKYPFEFYDAITHKAQTSGLLLGFKRVSVMGEFKVPRIGLVRVVNVHFTNWDFDARIRRKQLTETLEWLAARDRVKPAEITILGGDFNIERDSGDLAMVMDSKLTGTIKFADYNGTLPTRGSPGHPTKRIDYVFIATHDDKLRMLGEQRLFMDGLIAENGRSRYWPSDHVPVFHEYAVTPVDGSRLASAHTPSVINQLPLTATE